MKAQFYSEYSLDDHKIAVGIRNQHGDWMYSGEREVRNQILATALRDLYSILYMERNRIEKPEICKLLEEFEESKDAEDVFKIRMGTYKRDMKYWTEGIIQVLGHLLHCGSTHNAAELLKQESKLLEEYK